MGSKQRLRDEAAEEEGERHRLDKWLWCTRFFKTRGLAAQAIGGGRVHLNGARVKPAHRLCLGDVLSVSIDGMVADFTVAGLPERRGSAPVAREQYAETAASAARRAQVSEQQKLARLSHPRSERRPDKRERRELEKWRRSQG